MRPRALWPRLLTRAALAIGIGFALSPPRPRSHLPCPLALLLGVTAGAGLFAAASSRLPALRRSRTAVGTVLRHAVFGVSAVAEELVWRRAVLGELLAFGPLVALAVSSAGFAAAHRRGKVLHLGTGGVFGGVYLATGLLVAAVAAHWAYNAFVGSLLQREPP